MTTVPLPAVRVTSPGISPKEPGAFPQVNVSNLLSIGPMYAMPTENSVGIEALISRTEAGAAEARALRLFIGRGRRYSAKQAAIGSGVKERSIEAAMVGPDSSEWRPLTTGMLHSMIKFLGPDFMTEWLKPTGIAAHDPAKVDHEKMVEHAINYVAIATKARRRESPCGTEFAPVEEDELDRAFAPLRAQN